MVTRWFSDSSADVRPVGPAGGPTDGLQSADSVRRSTRFHLLGGRVSVTGTAGTSTGGLPVSLAGCLCVTQISCSLMRFILQRWCLDGSPRRRWFRSWYLLKCPGWLYRLGLSLRLLRGRPGLRLGPAISCQHFRLFFYLLPASPSPLHHGPVILSIRNRRFLCNGLFRNL